MNRHYRVTMTVVDLLGVSEVSFDVDAPSAFDAESDAHLIATQGEGYDVLHIVSVDEVIDA